MKLAYSIKPSLIKDVDLQDAGVSYIIDTYLRSVAKGTLIYISSTEEENLKMFSIIFENKKFLAYWEIENR